MSNIEKLAIQIHNNYIEAEKKSGNVVVDEKYEDLPAEYKLSNVRQAKSIPAKLKMIGCEIALKNDIREEYEFTADEIENMAIFEHERWCNEKIQNGWAYGEIRDEENKIHPSLVEWEKLSDEEKQKDRNSVVNIPDILNSIGLKVVISKLKLLTIEKHKYYSIKVKGKKFEELSKDIRFSNYKQTEMLVKSLGDMGYKLVSIDEPGEKFLFLQKKWNIWPEENMSLGTWTMSIWVGNMVIEEITSKR